tara:strand:- start:840 stop:2024 length:1185 start_codon:yes stop_codon:yes gene_type:complete
MINYKNFFSGLLVVALIFQISKFYTFYLEYSDWQYADWLINYQGGFIRRGFIGEILFKTQNFLSLDLDVLVLYFVILLYLVLTIVLIKSVKYLENSKIDILIFLSPGFFLYPIMNSEIVGRKEIFLFAILGLFVFFEKYVKDRYLLGITLFIILALSLTHTGLLFYSPYLLFLFFIIKVYRNKKFSFLEILIITTSLLVIFSLIYFNAGSKAQVVEICKSIKDFVKDDCINRGQFLWLYSPMTEYFDVKSRLNLSTNFVIYLISLFFVFIFFSIKLYFAKFKSNNYLFNSINPLIIFFILFLCTIPIYIVGIDWGRYISMSYFSTYFIYIYLIKQKMITFNPKKFLFKRALSKNIFFIFVFFYAFTWTFPFYGASNFKFTLKKPLISVLKIIDD